MKIKVIIRKLIPQGVRDMIWNKLRAPLNMTGHYARDAYRFWRYNVNKGRLDIASRSRSMTMLMHMLEKGLSLRSPRPYFGKDVVRRLMRELDENESRSDIPRDLMENAVEILESYRDFHRQIPGSDEDQKYILEVEAFTGSYSEKIEEPRAVLEQTRVEVVKIASHGSVSHQLKNRHSVRVFDKRKITKETLSSVIKMAQCSPSACNLQPVRVYALHSKEMIDKALEIQAGARGFYSEVQLLMVITYEIALQIGPRSRNQGYIDGGIFSQSLMLALLEEGIGSCPLNWAQETSTDKRMRKLIGVNDSENIVMLLSAGYLPEEYVVARSLRVPTENILKFVK